MDSIKNNPNDRTQYARLQAKTYEVLGKLFNQRPDADFVANIKAFGHESIITIGSKNVLNPETQAGLAEICAYVKQISEQPESDVQTSLQVDWTRLFRGIQAGYGPTPPYEGLYLGEGESDQRVLQAVAGFYHQYGVLPDENAGNRLDYIGIELEFLRYVCEQQAESWEKGDEIEAKRWQLAEFYFLRDHIGRWVAIFCDRAIEEAKTRFYRGCALLTKGIIEEMAVDTEPTSIDIN